MEPLAVTAGEPAGIGPDLIVALAAAGQLRDALVFADKHLLAARAKTLQLEVCIQTLDEPRSVTGVANLLRVRSIKLNTMCIPGQLNTANADYVLRTLTAATRACLDGECAALVTGPVHKGVINDAGYHFSGHTEFLAAQCAAKAAVMMLVCSGLRVALVTTHLPLSAVPGAITRSAVLHTLKVVHRSLVRQFDRPSPRMIVCGLNPHAGEGGHLGREEIETIEPAIATARGLGYNIIGPLPADTAFTPNRLAEADAVIAMYHDQGLPVLKHLGFGDAVNITLGLPLVRTSVDHGTALDRAATGSADPSSFERALKLARSMTLATLRDDRTEWQ